MLEHFVYIVDRAEAGRFGADQAAAEGTALAGDDAVFKGAADPAVLAVQEADFTASYAEVACRHVNIGPDVAIQLRHKGLAETHDFRLALSARIEIGTALCAAHGQCGQAVLEGLLESEELHDGKVDGGMEAKAALVRPDRSVVLNTIATVDMGLSGIVHPSYTEFNRALRLDHALQKGVLLILGVTIHHRRQRRENFFRGLQEFGFIRILLLEFGQNSVDILAHNNKTSIKNFYIQSENCCRQN